MGETKCNEKSYLNRLNAQKVFAKIAILFLCGEKIEDGKVFCGGDEEES